jgi:hypothetical protein
MEQKLTFTAYLKDEYSKRFDKLAEKSDDAIKHIAKDLDALAKTGNKAGKSIAEIEKRIKVLSRAKKLTIDTSAIKFATQEIKALEREKAKLEGTGGGGGGMFGGMGKGFAVAGTALAVGAALKDVASNAVDATAKYQKYEAVLTNTFGSKSAALESMDMLTKFAAETPFQIDELTGAYVKLVNQGFKPTRSELVSLGDLAASTGKGFDQLSEAILDAQTGEFERLKEFGIKAKKHKGDAGIDFMFKGAKTSVDGSSASIQKYLLSLGAAKGVTGAMGAISQTTGGQISNLEDNVDMLYKTIGERFKPTIDASIGSISSMVTTVKGWLAIPVEKKINDEILKIKTLQVELTNANTTEAQRKKILEELTQINPAITAGINAESIEYKKLADNIDLVTDALRKKIVESKLQEKFSSVISDKADLDARELSKRGDIEAKLIDIAPDIATNSALTFEQKMKYVDERIKAQKTGSGYNAYGKQAYLQGDIGSYKNIQTELSKLKPQIDVFEKQKGLLKESYDKVLSTKEKKRGEEKGSSGAEGTGSNTLGGSKGNKSKKEKSGSTDNSLGSISGGSKVTHLNISIGSLISGGFTVSSTTVKDSMPKIKDAVVEVLMTAVNDANLVAN